MGQSTWGTDMNRSRETMNRGQAVLEYDANQSDKKLW